MRLEQWAISDWTTLLQDYESDVALLSLQDVSSTQRTTTDVKKVAKACELMSRNKFGKARRSLTSTGISDPRDPLVAAQLEEKHPPRQHEIPAITPEQAASECATIDKDLLRQVIHSSDTDVSPGLGGLRYEHLHAILFNEHSGVTGEAKYAFDNFYELASKIVDVSLPTYFYNAYTAARVVPINKKETSDLELNETMPVRPLGVGECGRRLITRALMKPFIPIYADAMAPVQLGDGVKSGATKLIFAGKTHLSMNPDHVVIGIDIKNAFNATSRKHCLQYLWENPSLRPLYCFHHAILSPESYLGLDGGQNVIDSKRRSSEGFQQGSVEGSIDFDYTAYIAGCAETNAELESHPIYGALRAGRDDMYIYGPPDEAFAAFHRLKDRLATINLEIQPSKSTCYIHPRFRTPAFEELRTTSTIPFGAIKDSTGHIHAGISIFGIPVGEDSYVATWLEQKATSTLEKFETFKTLFNPSLHPEPSIPSRQCLFLLTLRCLQHMGSFYVRHLGPSTTGDYANTLDDGINELINLSTAVDVSTISMAASERIRLPIRFHGCGLRQLSDRRYVEYIGGFLCGVQSLLHVTDDGNADDINESQGWLHLPTTVDLFGDNAFHPSNLEPFKHMLQQHTTHEFSVELTAAWEHLQQQLQACQPDPTTTSETYIHNNIAAIGFSTDGKRPRSVTRALSLELEEARYNHLYQQMDDINIFPCRQEKIVFKNVDAYSSQFLHSACDSIGYLKDDQFAECFAQFLGLPSPSIQHFEGQYIGTEADMQMVDKYGNRVAAHRYLSGGGHIHFHNTMQHTLYQILRRCNFHTTLEAANIFHGIVPQPYISRYTSHYAQVTSGRYDREDAIIPDILVTDYPVKGASYQPRDGYNTMIPAMIEVKGLRITDNNYKLNGKAVEQRAARIHAEYVKKAKACDTQFAPETLHGNANWAI